MANVTRNKRSRAAYITSFRKIVDTTLKDIYETYTQDRLVDLNSSLTILQEKFSKISNITDNIISEIEEDNIEGEILKQTDFEEYACKQISILKAFIEKSNITINDHVSASVTSERPSKNVKLPRIELKKYNGDPLKFKEFMDTFKSSIDNNESLTDVEKLNYLKNLLTGPAEETVSGIGLCNDNYSVVLDLLHKRFGDEQVILSSHMHNLLTLDSVRGVSDVKGLRTLCDRIEGQVRCLEALGIKAKNYGPLLIPVIMTKIPNEMKLIISRKFENDLWDTEVILGALHTELQARERIKHSNLNSSDETFSNLPSTSFSLMTDSHQNDKKFYRQNDKNFNRQNDKNFNRQNDNKFHCIFCSRDHKAQDCLIVQDVSIRKNIIRNEQRCFICLRKGHQSKNCPSSSKIRCFTCKGRHHVAICSTPKQSNDQPEVPSSNNISQSDISVENSSVLLQTAKINVSNTMNTKSANLRVLFDLGSQRSYITPKAAQLLNLQSEQQHNMNIKVFGGGNSKQRLPRAKICFAAENDLKIYISAFVSEICQSLSGQYISHAISHYPHLNNLNIIDSNADESMEVDVLIGADFCWTFFTDEIIRGPPNTPVAIKTKFGGYLLSGPIVKPENISTTNLISTHSLKVQSEIVEPYQQLKNDLNTLWENDIFEHKTEYNLDSLKSNLEFTESRYQVRLPFNEHIAQLQDNFRASKHRLKNMSNKQFKTNKELLKDYDAILTQQLSDGIIEPAHNDTTLSKHFLPHRAVVKSDKTTSKVRIVFDASAKSADSPSLNDCLVTGPSLTPALLGVLLRFRAHNVAIVGDVEKAFHQISVHPDDRDFLSFLWFANPNEIDFDNFENNELVQYRLCRVLFGATSSPFILSGTIISHVENYAHADAEFSRKLLESLHVDDLNTGTVTVEQGFQFFTQAKQTLKDASFNLRKFQSNSIELENMIAAYDPTCMNTENSPKILGLKWDKINDTFIFDFQDISTHVIEPHTKRNVMHFIASIYDPLGLINPVVVSFKILLQDICMSKIDWDDALPPDIESRWLNLLQEFRNSPPFIIGRVYAFYDIHDPFVEIQLHGFSDASKRAQAACIYLRFVSQSGSVKIALLSAKSKNNPIKQTATMPRLELSAAVILAKLQQIISEHLKNIFSISNTFLWTDSSIAFAWIQNDHKKYPSVIQSRVDKIRNLTSHCLWKLVPSKDNAADINSRGCNPIDLCNSTWQTGPSFLMQSGEAWPDLKVGQSFTQAETAVQPYVTHSCISSIAIHQPSIDLSKVVNFEKYSSLNKLIRVTCFIMKFIYSFSVFKNKENNNSTFKLFSASTELPHTLPHITAEQYNLCKNLIIVSSQTSSLNDKNISHFEKTLNIFYDEDNILRCKGRIDNANLPHSAKYPILLLKDSYITKLVVLEAHTRVAHCKLKGTLNCLRQTYWIPRARSFIKKILYECRLCRKLDNKPYRYPITPPLPPSRVTASHAFESIGIDYAGPLFVKNVYDSFDNDLNVFKCWIALITCQASRAVHLDLATDCSAPSCINVLKRFISRRGTPRLITSDNGKSFIATETQNFAAMHNIKWKFNIENAPWMGGMFERLIQSVKRCLKKVLQNALVTYEELITILTEIEMILNNRPLTYIYDDVSSEPLTPNHLVYGRQLTYINNTDITDNNTPPELDIETRYKHVEALINKFWRLWNTEYLLALREYRPKSITNNRHRHTVNVNDIVLIMDDKIPRHKWRYGRISKLIDSTSDGLIRGVYVVVNSNGRLIEMRRPVNRLIPVELSVEKGNFDVDDEVVDDSVSDAVPLKFVDDESIGRIVENVVDKEVVNKNVVPMKFVRDDDVGMIKVFDKNDF